MRRPRHPLHQLRRVRGLRRLARACDHQVWARVYGVAHPVRLYMLRNASYLLHRRSPEPRVAALFLAILDTYPVASFWDVGANIGYYSWLTASARPDMKGLAIEPDLTNFDLLRQTQIHARGIEVLNVAASREDGAAVFLVDTVSGATGTLETGAETFNEQHYGESRVATAVTTRSLDSLTAEYGFPDFVKIDVEGHESAVVGGGEFLLKRRPIVIIETFSGSAAFATLHDAGYQLLDAGSISSEDSRDGNYLAIPDHGAPLLQDLRRAHACQIAAMGLGPC